MYIAPLHGFVVERKKKQQLEKLFYKCYILIAFTQGYDTTGTSNLYILSDNFQHLLQVI